MIILNGGAFFLGTGYFSDGSAALPSIAFASAPTTGIYLANAGTGQIAFSSLGQNVLFVYSNGASGTYLQGAGQSFFNFVNTGALVINAAGTNQNITLTPSTTGYVGIGGTNPSIYTDAGGKNLDIGTFTFGTAIRLVSANGNALFGTVTDSANGRIQLATHTTSAGGIGFGTDLSLFRFSATTLRLSAAANSYFSVDGPAANEVGFGYTKAGSTIWVSYVPSAGSTDLRWNNGSDRWLMNSAGQFLGITPTGGLGYGAGSGGTVTQITSKATAVTLSKVCGTITTHNASLAANTAVSFTLTNTAIAATDSIVFNVSAATAGAYIVNAQCGAGSATIELRNVTAGALAEAVAIRFAVIKSVNA